MLRRILRSSIGRLGGYRRRLEAEQRTYAENSRVHALPKIYDYWAWTYLRPMFEELGFGDPDQFFARFLRESAERTSAAGPGAERTGARRPVFFSIGGGNCDVELRVAKLLRASGLTDFELECFDLNRAMLARGRELVAREGLAEHFTFTRGDFNRWRPRRRYDGILASHSLHHVLRLEHLFDAVHGALAPGAFFVVSDMIGRNGHQRWPEARREVEAFWQELPPSHRFDHQLGRQCDTFTDWDCSSDGFEGIRAQDILPQLLQRFDFRVFLAFGGVIDPFVDRSYGPSFSPESAQDRAFIDRVHARNEELLRAGALTPTHMLAVLTASPSDVRLRSRGIDPRRCVRSPDRAPEP